MPLVMAAALPGGKGLHPKNRKSRKSVLVSHHTKGKMPLRPSCPLKCSTSLPRPLSHCAAEAKKTLVTCCQECQGQKSLPPYGGETGVSGFFGPNKARKVKLDLLDLLALIKKTHEILWNILRKTHTTGKP
jgi:hypothetical protein